jgi:trehalose 6-phosphate phosphatase
MKDILSPANRKVLRQFARSKVLLAFDYDGTLAPIVSRPERAVLRKTTCTLLNELAKRYPCVVISGRTRRDAMARLRGVRVHEILGNHGMEPWRGPREIPDLVPGWHALLESRLSGVRGVKVEDKTFSVAVHYRQSRDKKKARRAILRAAADLKGARLVGGEQAINIVPKGAPHKGAALVRERARFGCDTAIYLGDDETDEDVFRLGQPGRLLSVSVGRRRSSKAAYFIDGQRDIDRFLRILIALRNGAAHGR